MHKKNKNMAYYALFFQNYEYFCSFIRIIIQDEEQDQSLRFNKNYYLQ